MLIASLITTAALTGLVWSLNRDLMRYRRESLDLKLELHQLRQQISHSTILPDHKGIFRLHVPVECQDGLADGFKSFVPLRDLGERGSTVKIASHKDGKILTTQPYRIHPFRDGSHLATPAS